jgi:hypothetical protein
MTTITTEKPTRLRRVWRVRWHRVDWKPGRTRSRVFEARSDAVSFYALLQQPDDRWSAVAWVTLDRGLAPRWEQVAEASWWSDD